MPTGISLRCVILRDQLRQNFHADFFVYFICRSLSSRIPSPNFFFSCSASPKFCFLKPQLSVPSVSFCLRTHTLVFREKKPFSSPVLPGTLSSCKDGLPSGFCLLAILWHDSQGFLLGIWLCIMVLT